MSPANCKTAQYTIYGLGTSKWRQSLYRFTMFFYVAGFLAIGVLYQYVHLLFLKHLPIFCRLSNLLPGQNSRTAQVFFGLTFLLLPSGAKLKLKLSPAFSVCALSSAISRLLSSHWLGVDDWSCIPPCLKSSFTSWNWESLDSNLDGRH